ncbi:toll/interleukin-1 receptor domain-containing protein [Roseateles sp. BYS78W]|uniref:Toll/interleukin-1 receptor domain-containing protein n=1 Tax=Pelomonas candidula TaxID=3299025 RepID=A0ABW7HL36_9BURK
MKVFISHVHQEFALAKMVKEQLDLIFGAMVEVFLSEDTRLGDNWLAKVKTALTDSDFVFVLFSPTSHSRPWINIEAGYGVMAGKPVVPICCLGLKKSERNSTTLGRAVCPYRQPRLRIVPRSQWFRRLHIATFGRTTRWRGGPPWEHNTGVSLRLRGRGTWCMGPKTNIPDQRY